LLVTCSGRKGSGRRRCRIGEVCPKEYVQGSMVA
jgi:hypothetical protein